VVEAGGIYGFLLRVGDTGFAYREQNATDLDD
jgi:hypothetical protein